MGSSVCKKAHYSTDVFSSLDGAPTCSLVPPGKCQFTPEFSKVKLLDRAKVSETTSVLRFSLPDESQPLNLSTCACILAKADLPTGENGKIEEVVRPYTPISTNAQVGSFDLLIKHYPDGKMSQHMKNMPIHDTIEFKHIGPNVKIQAPFHQKKIGMLVGGTGITPMIQALHAILGAEEEDDAQKAKAVMLYGSKVASDILGREMLDLWEKNYGDQLSVTHVLSDEPKESEWKGERGFITKELLKQKLPPPTEGDNVIIFVCGPPPMYNAMCGPRHDKELSGYLKELGYKESQVFKF